MHVIFPAVQRVDELPDDKRRRIAGIVVDIFQAGIDDPLDVSMCAVFQKPRLISIIVEDL